MMNTSKTQRANLHYRAPATADAHPSANDSAQTGTQGLSVKPGKTHSASESRANRHVDRTVAHTHHPVRVPDTGTARLTREFAHLLWVGEYFLVACAVFGFGAFHWGWRGPTSEFGFVLAGFASSLVLAAVVVATQHLHGRLTMDHDLSGIQKSHQVPVPRIGGIAVFGAVIATGGFLESMASRGADLELHGWAHSLGLMALAGLPTFAVGLVEDITKRVSVVARLAASFVSACVAAWLLQAILPRLDIPGFDLLMAVPLVGLAFTVFAVGGMTNAINIIDGFNGLASGVSVLLGLGCAGLAALTGDDMLLALSLTLSAAAGGFMILNYPHGRLFLGDGGAYFIGFYIAELVVLLCARHPELSAWTLLTLISYPVVEVLVSIVRRKVANASPGQPDRDHMHQQMQRFLQRYLGGKGGGRAIYIVNPQVSPFVWFMNLLNVALAFACMGSKGSAFLGFVVSALLYLQTYCLLAVVNERDRLRDLQTPQH